jgi:glycosyltransferase involved in cell wall biosynthesis
VRRRAKRRLRVFVGPVEIAGHYARLARGLRAIGVDAVAVDLNRHPFRYDEGQRDSRIVAVATALNARSQEPSRARAVWRLADRLIRLVLVVWCLARFDAFIFGFGTTILGGPELPLLRLLGKRVVFVFNGSDARPPYVDGAEMAAALGRTVDDCIRLTARRKANIRRIERYAHAVVSQPTFSHFFERPVVDFFRLGVPWTAAPDPVQRPRDPGEIRILHSPSNPEVKGSEQIRKTVDDLRGQGLPIRLVELRGVPNAVVRSEIAQADFVIDQIYSDAPMVGFATEAAAAGVAAIVGGYAWPHLRRIYPDGAMPPVEQCRPDELAAAIRRLAEDPERRRSLGEDARAFVEGPWALERIAERYLAVLIGDIPMEWLFDPRDLRYVRGVGLTEERARELVRDVVERGGARALQLEDKPEVERAFLRFAAGEGVPPA